MMFQRLPNWSCVALVVLFSLASKTNSAEHANNNGQFLAGKALGEYEDFVTPEGNAWGRPVGITVAKDGSLLFRDGGNGTIWRVSYGK
jgi:glucose/arabinose dehydrogenase